jgi:anti-anti-sigma factor
MSLACSINGKSSIEFSIHGGIDLMNCSEYRESIRRQIVDSEYNELILNLSCVDSIDSSAIGVFLQLQKMSHRKSMNFAIKTPSKKVHSVLRLAKFDRIFPILW